MAVKTKKARVMEELGLRAGDLQASTLYRDAWNRLKKNKMAIASFFLLVIIALIAGLTAVACVVILTTSLVSYKKTSGGGGLTATGSASCDFESDLIVWRGSFSAYGVTTSDAYAVIKNDSEVVRQYLLENGVSEEELVFSSVDISQRYRTEYDENGNYSRD